MSGEAGYLALLRRILAEGCPTEDRTGTGTLSLFGERLEFDLSGGQVPVLTTKQVAWKTCLKELCWFLRGETDARKLQAQNVHIWDGNTSREFLDSRGLTHYPEGDIGPGYGFQWRHFGAEYTTCEAPRPQSRYSSRVVGIDQLQNVLDTIKTDPTSRRIYFTAWNPAALSAMALPPCHVAAQFYVREGRLSCQVYQRSVDVFLGLPFNLFSYAAMTSLFARWCGLEPHRLIFCMGDTHIYKDHIGAVREQLTRTVYPFPRLIIKESADAKTLDDIEYTDFDLTGYQSHGKIAAKMSV